MRIISDVKLDFDDVLIVPKRSKMATRSQVDLMREYLFLNSKRSWKGIPIIASNMSATGTFAMAKALHKESMVTALCKHYSEDELVDFFANNLSHWNSVFYTIGMSENDWNKLLSVKKRIEDKLDGTFPSMLCVDIANGYQEAFVDFISEVREKLPSTIIACGNVVTPEMTEQLLINGADIIKIGIGSGSCCVTRLKAGCGYPQLSAIIECADHAHGLGGHIMSDGGCRYPADVVKCFAANSDFSMLGGMFSGVDQCDGEWVERLENGEVKKYFKLFGMSSKEAMEKYNGGMASYRASEGKCVDIPYKGDVKDVVQDILGGLRSACSYTGAQRLKDLSKCTTFVRVNRTHNTVFGE